MVFGQSLLKEGGGVVDGADGFGGQGGEGSALVGKRDKGNASNGHWFAQFLNLEPGRDKQGQVLKIEPKVFFANERTFLAWFNSAIFASSVGIAVKTSGAQIPGGLLVGVGVLVIAYAIATYMQRTSSLLNRKASGYHDKYGPIFLSFVVVTIFIGAFIYI